MNYMHSEKFLSLIHSNFRKWDVFGHRSQTKEVFSEDFWSVLIENGLATEFDQYAKDTGAAYLDAANHQQ